MIKLEKLQENQWVFNNDLINHSEHERLYEAMDLWHDGEIKEAETLLKDIISKNSYHIDAYHHLSMLYESNQLNFEAYLCCREAVRIGLSIIPKNFSWSTSKIEWSYMDNRPFLRAYHNLGLWLEKRNELKEAITIFSNILSLSPNDNLGVRYILPKLWLETGDLLSIVQLCTEYQDDYSPELMYTYPLVLVLLDEKEKAKKLIAKAKKAFPLVAKELKKKRHPKPKSLLEGAVMEGGADQAYEYWKQYGKYWSNSSEAMSFL